MGWWWSEVLHLSNLMDPNGPDHYSYRVSRSLLKTTAIPNEKPADAAKTVVQRTSDTEVIVTRSFRAAPDKTQPEEFLQIGLERFGAESSDSPAAADADVWEDRLPPPPDVLRKLWAAFQARQALSVTWSRTGTAWGFDSDKGSDSFAADARRDAHSFEMNPRREDRGERSGGEHEPRKAERHVAAREYACERGREALVGCDVTPAVERDVCGLADHGIGVGSDGVDHHVHVQLEFTVRHRLWAAATRCVRRAASRACSIRKVSGLRSRRPR